METYFSVGEISKLTSVPIQTLRYYDKIGLLKPAYIDEKSSYRYYSLNQFIKIDLLKQCKLIGLSLKEIEELLKDEITADSMKDIISNQKAVLDEKIKELQTVKTYIEYLDSRIDEFRAHGGNEIFIRHHEDRVIKKHSCIMKDQKDFEYNLRNILLKSEQENWMLNCELVFEASFEKLAKEDRVEYTAIMLYKNDMAWRSEEDIVLPKGKYLTMFYDDGYKDNLKYYRKMLKYIKENNLETDGSFYEFSILSRLNDEGNEKSIIQLEIQIK